MRNAVWAVLALSWTTGAIAATTVGVAPSYFTGDYGTSSTTQMWYVPFYADFQGKNFRFKVTVPYLRVATHGAVISGGNVVGSGNGSSTSAAGLGDIWLKGSYVIHGVGTGPDYVPYVKEKLGTASRSAGLGTGANDTEVGLELDWTLAPETFPYVEVGYRQVGAAPGLNLQNILTYQGGVTIGTGGHDFVTAILSGHGSEQPGFADAADAVLAWNFSPPQGTGYGVFFDKGLTSGSPNYGVGVSIQNRF